MKKSDVQREIDAMTKNMSKYKTTILQVAIHRTESQPYDEEVPF